MLGRYLTLKTKIRIDLRMAIITHANFRYEIFSLSMLITKFKKISRYRTWYLPTVSGVPRGDAQDARASPPPGHVHPPLLSMIGWL